MKTTRKSLRIALGYTFLILLVLYGYKKYTVANKESHIELAAIAKDKLDSLGLDFDGKIIYEQYKSSRKCNHAEHTVVYSSPKDPLALCLEVTNKLNLEKWKHTQNCRIIGRDKAGIAPAFNYYNVSAVHTELKYKDHFDASFFPLNSSHPYFIGAWHDVDVVKAAKKLKQNFYFVKYYYQGPWYEDTYKCNEATLYCECAYSTYVRSILHDSYDRILFK